MYLGKKQGRMGDDESKRSKFMGENRGNDNYKNNGGRTKRNNIKIGVIGEGMGGTEETCREGWALVNDPTVRLSGTYLPGGNQCRISLIMK